MKNKKNILIVGNGPSCNLKFIEYFKEHVILGRAIFYINKDIDKWVTRKIFLNQISHQKINETHLIPENYKDEYDVMYPTLGYYAILKYVNLNYDVFVTGITFDMCSNDIDSGTWWDFSEKRNNIYHNLLKETVILNKLKTNKSVYEL